MLTRRRTKLAIAVAILIVGVGAAFLFRREDPLAKPTASKKPPSTAAERSVHKPETKSKTANEPALAGHIEPYGWKNRPSDIADQTVTDKPAATVVPKDGHSSSVASQSASGRITGQQPASYAESSDIQHAPTNNPPRRPPFDIAAEFDQPASSDPNAALFNRFAAHPPPSAAMLAGKRHKIIDGDTLTAIANRYLGSEERYLDLFEHNRDVLTHPELLPIGKELRIPPPGFVRAAEPPRPSQSSNLTEVAPVPGPSDFRRLPQPRSTQPALATTDRAAQQTYVVQAHDTLGLIARKVYGDIARQSELLAANRQQLRTPQDLRPGMTLIVPAAKKSQ